MPPYIEAHVRLFVADAGGRHLPIDASAGTYAPHLQVGDDGEYLGVRLVQGPRDFRPGEAADVVCELLYEEVDYSRLRVGSRFRILEGPHAVGEGEVTGKRR